MRRVTSLALMLAGSILLGLPNCGLAQVAPPAGKLLPAGDYAAIALDPASAGVSAVNAAADLMKTEGTAPDQEILYFTNALDATKNASVARMIRFQLVQLYKEANRNDQALQVLKDLMTMTPVLPSLSQQVIQVLPATTGDAAANPSGQQQ